MKIAISVIIYRTHFLLIFSTIRTVPKPAMYVLHIPTQNHDTIHCLAKEKKPVFSSLFINFFTPIP